MRCCAARCAVPPSAPAVEKEPQKQRRNPRTQQTPKTTEEKRTEEKALISEMIVLYCRRQHKSPKGQLCPECRDLQEYALARIDC